MPNDETKPTGVGCFAKGCLITILAGFTLLILFVGGTWYFYYKAVERFTSPQPVQIAIDPVTDAGYKGAEEMLNRLRVAAIHGKERNHRVYSRRPECADRSTSQLRKPAPPNTH